MPEPIVEEELAYVLAEAVEAYKVAALRDRSTGSYSFRGYTAEVLIKKFPKHFCQHSDGKARYIGKSASEILENYLVGLGYERESTKWYELAHNVIDLATEETEDATPGKLETVKAARQGRNRSRNERKVRNS